MIDHTHPYELVGGEEVEMIGSGFEGK